MGWCYLKTFFSRTTGPILIKLGTKSSLGGGNSEKVKIQRTFLEIFFSRTRGPISTKLSTNYPWVKGIQVSSNKGPDPLQRGVNHKNVKKKKKKIAWCHLKIFFPHNHWVNFNQTWHISLGGGNSSFFK
jgi:hypothetical protein